MRKNIEETKQYHREYIKKHYQANKAKYVEAAKLYKIKIQEFIRQKKDKPCQDCKQSYPYYVMQFDHVGNDKTINIADIVRRGWGIKRIEEELAKCELVCANCHAIRTFNRYAVVV